MMLQTFIATAAVTALIAIWLISARRRLAILDENTKSAMNQIGIQLSSRFAAITELLNLMEDYGVAEGEKYLEPIKYKWSEITAESMPDDVIYGEGIISGVLWEISRAADRHPKLKTDETYIKNMGAVQTFEKMVRTSRLIYNDSVTKLNSEIQRFPVFLIAGTLGFRRRNQL